MDYHVYLKTKQGSITISQLGRGTEDFFENLYDELNAFCAQALFAEGSPLISAEGDYTYCEGALLRHSHAKFELYADGLFVYPHDIGARRVPLYFCSAPVIAGFSTTLSMTTGDWYSAARLGKDTEEFNARLMKAHSQCEKQWNRAHRQLEATLTERLGDAYLPRYQAMEACGASMASGLFTADEVDESGTVLDDEFWFAGELDGKVAVEFVLGEAAATYLYDFGAAFSESALRQALEAVGSHREIIFLDEEEIDQKPLYRVFIDRCRYVRLLRECNVGRIVHNARWEEGLRAFFDA